MSTSLSLSRSEGAIAYEVSGEGPLVICIPGMGDIRFSYRFLVPALVRSGYRVVTMDLRGHGDSDTSFSTYDDIATAEDVLALIEHLGGPAVLIGSSLGGAGAVYAAAQRPEVVTSLVLLDAFVREQPSPPGTKLAFRLLLTRPWGPVVWAKHFAGLYPSKPDGFPEHADRVRKSLARKNYWRAFARTARTSHAPVERELGKVRARTLVVMGENDRDFKAPRKEAAFIGEQLNGEVFVVDGAGHYPHVERAEVVNPVVVEFLGRGEDHA